MVAETFARATTRACRAPAAPAPARLDGHAIPALAASLMGGTASAASSTVSAGSPATAVSHTVTRAAQSAAHSFWTRSRMESATPVGQAAPRGGAQAGTAEPPPGIPSPTYFDGVPTVGRCSSRPGRRPHFCTASVVDSATFDLVLTAAHCVYGTSYATNIAYVPQWHNGVSPYGPWAVRTITAAAGYPWASYSDYYSWPTLRPFLVAQVLQA
jgi:hypothetical protein